jgi:peptide deformylase
VAVREILLLGHPGLYQESEPFSQSAAGDCAGVARDLHDTLMDFRHKYGYGRAIAAPQIGVARRIVYMNIDGPVTFINPVLEHLSSETFELWDDCMCFPDLLVRVQRHRRCRIHYRDLQWNERTMELDGDLSELLQHECDHLDGILAVSRALDLRSFALRSQRALLGGGDPEG